MNTQGREPSFSVNNGTLDGSGATDHDEPFRFGRRPSARAPFPCTERQYARLLVFRSRLSERRDWLWAAAIVPSQVTTMMATSGDLVGGLGLWPLMVAFSSILSAPFVGASYVGSWLRRGTVREAQ